MRQIFPASKTQLMLCGLGERKEDDLTFDEGAFGVVNHLDEVI